VRAADLIVFMLSAFEIEQYDRLREELYHNKIRVDKEPPRISIRRKGKGGLRVTSSVEQDLDEQTIKEVLRSHEFINADITLNENVDIDRLIDGIQDNRVYLPSIVTVNKTDLIDPSYIDTVKDDLRDHDLDPEEVIFISAEKERGLDSFKERIWEELGLIRIYMDKPGRGIDYEEPLMVDRGSTVEDATKKLGGEFQKRFRFARVSGESAKHDGQQVGLDHELADEDVLRLITRK
jgi:hypothetical protein